MASFTYTTNGNKVAADIDSKLRQVAYNGLKASAGDMRKEMYLLSSGTISSAQLRKYDYPFATAHLPFRKGGNQGRQVYTKKSPRPVSLLPINKQTGALHKSYFDYFSRQGRFEFNWTFGFANPYSGWVLYPGGLKRMVDRHFWDVLAKTMKPKFMSNMQSAYSQMFP